MDHEHDRNSNSFRIGVFNAAQIRAARAMLRWPARLLAERAGVHITTVQRLENGQGRLRGNLETAERISVALEEGGVEFLPNDGIRLRHSPDSRD